MKLFYKFTFLLLSTAFLTACGGGSEPDTVAKEFWQALNDKKIDDAKALTMKGDQDNVSTDALFNDKVTLESYILSPAKTTETESVIETDLEMKINDKVIPVPLNTVMIQEDGDWKVDFTKTMTGLDKPIKKALGGNAAATVEKFWNAVKAQDTETAKPLIVSRQQADISDDEFKDDKVTVNNITIGEATANGEMTKVETALDLTMEGESISIEFDSIAEKEGDEWKIDMEKTGENMAKPLMEFMMKKFAEQMEEMPQLEEPSVEAAPEAEEAAPEDQTEPQ